MEECSVLAAEKAPRFSAHASLCALGIRLQEAGVWSVIEDQVKIGQKTVKYTPASKLKTVFAGMLCGMKGVVEVNKEVRPDAALCQAFGCAPCDQSVAQDTLSACTKETVDQMQEALSVVFQRHSLAFRHPYATTLQLLDVDLTGLPCGRKAELATKGYFAQQRGHRGRQMGRVLATRYDEIVVDRLYPGTEQLSGAFPELLVQAQSVLALDEKQRERTLLRVDGGAGTMEDINAALDRGYHLLAKVYSWKTARALCATVPRWVDDPRTPGRQAGWVAAQTSSYHRPLVQIGVRCPKGKGGWGCAVIVCSLAEEEVLSLVGWPLTYKDDPDKVLLAYVLLYDHRGGGVETAIKEDKQGLFLTRRNKRSFDGQQVLVALATLAHNVLLWARDWLLPSCPRLAPLGIVRLVRDVFRISGHVSHTTITLNQNDPWARHVAPALDALLQPLGKTAILGQT